MDSRGLRKLDTFKEDNAFSLGLICSCGGWDVVESISVWVCGVILEREECYGVNSRGECLSH